MLYIDLTVVQRVRRAFSGIREADFVRSFCLTTLLSESHSCHQRCRSLDNAGLAAKEMKEKRFLNQCSQGEPYNSPRAAFFFLLWFQVSSVILGCWGCKSFFLWYFNIVLWYFFNKMMAYASAMRFFIHLTFCNSHIFSHIWMICNIE